MKNLEDTQELELCPYADICEVENGDDYICGTDYEQCRIYQGLGRLKENDKKNKT